MGYWEECISEAFEDAGIKATSDQIDTVASWVEGAHENYGMAHGHDQIPNPLASVVDDLRRKLQKEDRKVYCDHCGAKGWITYVDSVRSSTSQCPKCRGEGKHLP